MKKSTLKDDPMRIHEIIAKGVAHYLKEAGLPPDAENVHKGRAFTEFYVRDIAYQTDGLTDEDRVAEGLACDGSNDLGIDFIYPKEDNGFWMCQAKFKKPGGSLTRNEIAGFFAIYNRIRDPQAVADANDTVAALLQGFDASTSEVSFVLLTNAKATPANREEFERGVAEARRSAGDNADNFDWQLIDADAIGGQYHQSLTPVSGPAEPIRVPLLPHGRGGGYIDLSDEVNQGNGGGYKTFVTVVNGVFLSELYDKYGQALFDSNIRFFLGKNKKNKGMIRILDGEEPHEQPRFFYLYNNGISAICTDMSSLPGDEGDGCAVQCKGFQIINGAQTTCSIYEFCKNNPGKRGALEKVRVLLRVSQVKRGKDGDEVKTNIIRFNNTQSVIKDSDFRANDTVQSSLAVLIEREKFRYQDPPLLSKKGKPSKQKRFKTLLYAPKRIDPRQHEKGAPPKDVVRIGMEDMAKSLFSFMEDAPHVINSQSSHLFNVNSSEGGMYLALFGEPSHPATRELATKCAAIAMVNLFIKFKHKEGRRMYSDDTVEGMVHSSGRWMLWAFGYVIRNREEYKNRTDEIYRLITAGDGSAFDSQGFVSSLYDAVYDRLCIGFGDAARPDNGDGNGAASRATASKGKVFNFKLWLRQASTVGFLQLRLRALTESNAERMKLPKIKA